MSEPTLPTRTLGGGLALAALVLVTASGLLTGQSAGSILGQGLLAAAMSFVLALLAGRIGSHVLRAEIERHVALRPVPDSSINIRDLMRRMAAESAGDAMEAPVTPAGPVTESSDDRSTPSVSRSRAESAPRPRPSSNGSPASASRSAASREASPARV